MPTIVGDYLIEQTIGEGTFGKVKLGVNRTTNKKVAVKILEKSKIVSQADIERVKRELTILQMLNHPHIAKLYEIIESDQQLFLFMEYASGGELFDYIVKNQRVKEQEACKFFQQILAGVEYIHSMGIVHRDLKPENLLLTADKDILIVDFGLSNLYQSNQSLKTACGSPCYAAPEMICGKPYNGSLPKIIQIIGLQADIWSCGVILFAMICGFLPFEDENTQILYQKILSADLRFPKYLSNEAKSLIKSILTVNTKDRYTLQDIRNHKWYSLHQEVYQNKTQYFQIKSNSVNSHPHRLKCTLVEKR